MVYEALLWLQNHNPIYADIHIDRNCLQELPEDDIPDELLAIVRQEDDDELAEKERELYLPPDVTSNDTDGDDDNDLREDVEDGEFFFHK